MARPFIREPDLAKRWQQGDRSPARCISCNGCLMPGIKEGGIGYAIDEHNMKLISDDMKTNVDKAENILNWKAVLTLEDAMRDAWKWQLALEKNC